MLKRAVVVVVAILALAIGGSALAATNHRVNATIKAANVDTAGSTTISAGTIFDRVSRQRGAVVFRTTVQSDGTTAQTFTTFFTNGSIKGKGTLTGTPNPNGTVSFTGTEKVTGGTGRYRRARGTLKTTGTLDPSTGRSTATATGTVRY